MKKGSCKIHPIFKSVIPDCYGKLTSENEETTVLEQRYNYSTTHSGYMHLLPHAKNETIHFLAELRRGKWLDRGTRTISIQFTIYNANVNLFCIVTVDFVFTRMGGMDVEVDINTLRLLRHVTTWDNIVLGLEVGSFI